MIKATFKADELIEDYKSKLLRFPDAMRAAMNESAAQGRTFSAKQITEKYNILSADVKYNLKLTKATNARLLMQIDGYGAGISLRRYAAKRSSKLQKTSGGVKRYIVRAKIFKSKPPEIVRGIFGLSGKLKTTMKRSGTSRLPLDKAFGPGMAYLFSDRIKQQTINKIQFVFPNIFINKFKYFYQ